MPGYSTRRSCVNVTGALIARIVLPHDEVERAFCIGPALSIGSTYGPPLAYNQPAKEDVSSAAHVFCFDFYACVRRIAACRAASAMMMRFMSMPESLWRLDTYERFQWLNAP
jgi:hypothetical protein